MRTRWAARAVIIAGAALLAIAGAFAGQTITGEWKLGRSETPGAVQFSMQGARGGNWFSSRSDWPLSDFSGLDVSRPGAQETRFTLARDAGTFEFKGALRDGVGAGSFEFVPNESYAQEMKALGFGAVGSKHLSLALHDVSLSFARDMKNESLRDLDVDKLLAFRIHGVTREMVQRVRAAGYTPDSQSLIAMRIHGATLEWMEELKRVGYERVPLDELVAFRIHDVTPDFIGELQKLGFKHPDPEQLVTLRIHGVTPEYIGELQARGVQGLTIDKLVAMKIHGLE